MYKDTDVVLQKRLASSTAAAGDSAFSVEGRSLRCQGGGAGWALVAGKCKAKELGCRYTSVAGYSVTDIRIAQFEQRPASEAVLARTALA